MRSSDCAICMEPMRGVNPNISMKFWALLKQSGRFNPKNQCEKLKCGHKFHSSCISEWFLKIDSESSGNCPLCREKIKFSNKLGMTNRKMYIQKEFKEDIESFEEERPTWYRADPDYSDSSDSEDEYYESHDIESEEDVDLDEEYVESEEDEGYDIGFDEDSESDDDDEFENERNFGESHRGLSQSIVNHFIRNAIPPQQVHRRPIRPGTPYRQRVCYSSESRFKDWAHPGDFYRTVSLHGVWYLITSVFDRSYQVIVYRIIDNTKVFLRFKWAMDRVYNKISVRGKKKYVITRQGQDFGCALI